MDATIFIYLLITIMMCAFFSGMEIAFVSVDKLRLKLDEKGRLTSKILNVFFHSPNNFISTMLVGNNIMLVIYGIFMAHIIGYLLFGIPMGNESNGNTDNFMTVLIETLISTLIILLTGEFLPKSLFKINPSGVLCTFAVPLFFFYIILCPISKFASGISYLCLRMFGMKINRDTESKAFGKVDLDYFIQLSLDHADDKEEVDNDVKIFQNALDFSNVKVRDCIVPRTEVIGVDKDSATIDQLMTVFVESGLSKVIVYDGNIDNVVGYIHSSEMFRDPNNWKDNIKKIPIVPETMAAHKLMKLFMQQKRYIAVVVDEFGGTSGIVTLEDIVEEIFGDIEDEHDTSSYVCKQVADNEYVLSARLEIEKVNETFDLELPVSDDYLTVGGLILNKYQSFPKLHEVVTIGDYHFKILKITPSRIDLVSLKVEKS
jgi:CBS domain containing-hemolysin-like protein